MTRIGTGKLRQQNDHTVLRLLIENPHMTKKELAQLSSLTVATVGTILNDFVHKGIVQVSDEVHLAMGRPTQRFVIQEDFFHILSIFIQRQNNQNYLCYEIKNALSQILQKETIELDSLEQEMLIKKIIDIYHRDSHIQIVGIGVPAIVSNGVLIESDIPELKGWLLKEQLEQKISCPIIIKNDMNYTAYGYYASQQLHEDICFVTYPSNSGPGCGSMINGQLLEGRNEIAGEILYLPFFHFLSQKQHVDYSVENVALSLCCIASILNPSIVVLTGEAILASDIEAIEQICLQYIPEAFMPKIYYQQDYNEYYMQGIYLLSLKFLLDQV